ncbi:MAG TPA: phosphatase PAP2 family protein [Pyrinomonadaceae bacterium]|nr:phosphatase PAP2 family protein [Pyrinomonadaceae bacterium]
MRRNRSSQCLFGMIVIALMLTTVRAQTPHKSDTTPSLEHEFFKNILSDQKAIWTAPLRLQRRDTKWAIPVGIGFMALVTTDRITGDEIAESDAPVKMSRIVSNAGSVCGLGTVAGAFYLFGRNKNDDRARETGLLSAEALVNSVIVGSALKGITQRARPMAGRERSEFFDGGNSFPSGHSTQAWAVATVIANEYHDHRSVQLLAYGAAAAVSVARFTGQKHYLSDVVAGSALGYVIGKYVYTTHHRKSLDSIDDDEPVSRLWRPMITPQFNHQARAYGLSLTWSF